MAPNLFLVLGGDFEASNEYLFTRGPWPPFPYSRFLYGPSLLCLTACWAATCWIVPYSLSIMSLYSYPLVNISWFLLLNKSALLLRFLAGYNWRASFAFKWSLRHGISILFCFFVNNFLNFYFLNFKIIIILCFNYNQGLILTGKNSRIFKNFILSKFKFSIKKVYWY